MHPIQLIVPVLCILLILSQTSGCTRKELCQRAVGVGSTMASEREECKTNLKTATSSAEAAADVEHGGSANGG